MGVKNEYKELTPTAKTHLLTLLCVVPKQAQESAKNIWFRPQKWYLTVVHWRKVFKKFYIADQFLLPISYKNTEQQVT